MKKDLAKFLAGAAVGAGLGIAASKYLDSESGKKSKESLKKIFTEFYAFLGPRIKMVKNLTKAKYKEIITEAAHDYGKAKKMSAGTVDDLIEKTVQMWDDFIGEEEE